jgi:hypothetical protein
MTEEARPVTVQYFYRVRWGHHDEWLELFRRNHWPLLREGLRSGRYTDVRLFAPRFHGVGHADWDVLVTITYRDWAALQSHTPDGLIERLFPDQESYKRDEQRRFELLEAHWDVPLEDLELAQD